MLVRSEYDNPIDALAWAGLRHRPAGTAIMEAHLYHLMRELEDEHWWFVARRKIIASLLETLNLPADAEILDVGCGTGGNLAILGHFGQVTGIEHDPVAAELARQRKFAPIFPGNLPDELPDLAKRFDLITLLDVIEHVEDHVASLRNLAGWLNPGGRILITVPAFNFLWSQHDDENHHKRRYRRRDLEQLAHSANLSVQYMGYFNTWLFPPVAAIRLVRKLFPGQQAFQDMRMPARLVNQALTWIFGSERRLIGRVSLPFGISLLAVVSSRN